MDPDQCWYSVLEKPDIIYVCFVDIHNMDTENGGFEGNHFEWLHEEPF